MAEISFQEFHNIKHWILCFEVSCVGVHVITRPRCRREYVFLSLMSNLSDTKGFKSSPWAKLGLLSQMFMSSLFTNFSLYRPIISFLSMCSILPLSFRVSFTHFSLNSISVTTIAFSALGFEGVLFSRTVIVGFMEFMRNGQTLNRLNRKALKSKKFLERLHEADFLLARKSGHKKTDKADCRVQSKSGIAHQMNARIFRECNDIVLREIGTDQACQILLVPTAAPTYWLKDLIIVSMYLHLIWGN